MAETPPDLRFATDDRDCSSCVAFKPKSQTCSMFNDYPVAPDLVCDDYEGDEVAEDDDD